MLCLASIPSAASNDVNDPIARQQDRLPVAISVRVERNRLRQSVGKLATWRSLPELGLVNARLWSSMTAH